MAAFAAVLGTQTASAQLLEKEEPHVKQRGALAFRSYDWTEVNPSASWSPRA